ncbi:MAG: rhodanese-like domain-containing protein [Flavobacteriales bacterium]|nr:rhodanese-like domain-containing protein [Flavobacteriales bacterium]
MKKVILAIGLLSGGVFFSTTVLAQGIEQSAQTIKRVTKTEFKDYLDKHDKVQLIDVRTPGEFGGGTIDGAKNIDFNNPNFKSEIAKLDKDVPTLIFCRSGGRSAKALQIFKAEGFDYVLELEGGYLNW